MKTTIRPLVFTVLESLTSDQLIELRPKIDELYRKKYDEEKPRREAMWKKQAEEREARKAKEEADRPALLKFIKSQIKVGMWVKLKGTRDRGYREITRINDNDTITGWQLRPNWRTINNANVPENLEVTNVATTNDMGNIVQLYQFNQWKLVKRVHSHTPTGYSFVLI